MPNNTRDHYTRYLYRAYVDYTYARPHTKEEREWWERKLVRMLTRAVANVPSLRPDAEQVLRSTGLREQIKPMLEAAKELRRNLWSVEILEEEL